MAEGKNAKSIFLEAIEKPVAERAGYLDEVAGEDIALRLRVEALLAAHDNSDSFLQQPGAQFGATVDLSLTEPPLAERAGTVVGPYKLLEQIGEGGMGVVYMAEQQVPIRRRVALKVIKVGMDTRQVIARFEAERQALALMDHSNIARVLDAGATESGRPYFVMELVRGVAITEYCDQNNLPVHERLELFVQVCHAVQHAHQKGIIHRDIKPSNVLVTVNDDRAVPKVIDFGVAKATNQQLTEKTLFTAFTQIVGTPLYMSPEQAEMSSLDIDTRSDIYSLGVLLYELLTGTTPFDQERLRAVAYAEMVRIIREEEPPKPSTRISSLGEARSVMAAHRKIDGHRLGQLVEGDLDWIVMMSLEKNRSRRYDTASGFAEDIHRYLSDQPVEARPPSARYRFRKFARRNKNAVLTATAVTLALLLAVVTLAVSNARITIEKNQKSLALRNREVALEEKEVALKDKAVALVSARASEREARSQEVLARRRFYASQMNLAMQAWEAGQPARMLQLLESQRPRFDQDDLRGFDWYYLWRLCQGALRFSLPTRNVDNSAAIAISYDGKTLASGYGHAVRLWDVSTHRQVGELLGHKNTVGWLAFSPDGKTLASTDQVETVKLWDLTTRKERAILNPGQAVRGLQFTRDSRILALAGESVQLWDVLTNREICKIAEFGKELVGLEVVIAPDGNTVVVCGSAKVRTWIREGSAWREAKRIQGDYYRSAAISPDGKLLAVGGSSLKLYDLPTRHERISLEGHVGAVFAVAFSGDGKRLASGGADRTVRMWEVATGKQQVCIAHPGPVYGLALAPDASVVAAMGTDAIRVWDVAPLAPAVVLRHAAPVYGVAYSPDGKMLASDGTNGTKLWDPFSGREISTLGAVPALSKRAYAVSFSPDGKSLASSGVTKNTIDVWDVTGGRLATLTTGGDLYRLVFSPDGKSLAEASVNYSMPCSAAVWDLASQQRRFTLQVSNAPSAVAYSPDGKTIAVGGQFGVVKLFDAQSGRELATLQRFVLAVDWILAMAFSPDGHTLAAGNAQGVVHIWDVATDHLKTSLLGHTDAVQSLAFGDGGRTLATASEDRTIRLWDVATGQERITLKGHEGKVTCVAFAPDGNTLATSSNDGTVRLWSAATDAEARARKREVDPDDEQSPAAHNERGDRLWQYGRVIEAESAYRQALTRLEQLRIAFPGDPAYSQEIVRSLLSLNLLLRLNGDSHAQAEPARLQAGEIYRALSIEEQAVTYWAFRERQRHLYSSGNTQQADRTFTQAIELISQDDVVELIQGARHMASSVNVNLRDPARAVELARHAVSATTKNRKDRAEALLCLGDVLENDKRSAEAMEAYQQTTVQFSEDLTATPGLSNVWSGRAFAHLHLQEWQPAIDDFTKAIELDPKVHQNWFHRGSAYIALAQWDKAAADFTKVIDGWPDDVWGWYSRAQIYAQTDRPAEAIADLRQAIAKGFNDPLRMRTEVKFESIRANDEFKKLLAELEKKFRPPLNTLKGAEYLRNTGELDEAIKVCTEIISREPDTEAAWLERGNCYLRKGAFAKAIDDYTRAIQQKPDNWWSWHERAYCYLMLEQHEKSVADHSRAIELQDQEPGQRVRRGNSYRALGQLQKAEEDYTRAIELSATDWASWYARARLYSQQHNAAKSSGDLASLTKLLKDPDGQNEVAWSLATDPDPSWRNSALAVELAEKAIAARPTDGMIWNTVGAARYRNGQWKGAIAAFEKSMQFRNGGDSSDWFFLAMAHWRHNDEEDARKWYGKAVEWMDKNQPKNDDLIRFRHEADQLLNGKPTVDVKAAETG